MAPDKGPFRQALAQAPLKRPGATDDPIKVQVETKEVTDLELARWMINTMNRAAKTQTGPPSAAPLLERPVDDDAD